MNISDLVKGNIFLNRIRNVPVIITRKLDEILEYTCLRSSRFDEPCHFPAKIGTTNCLPTDFSMEEYKDIELLELRYHPANETKNFGDLFIGEFFLHPTYHIPCMIQENKDNPTYRSLVFLSDTGIMKAGDINTLLYWCSVNIIDVIFSNEVDL